MRYRLAFVLALLSAALMGQEQWVRVVGRVSDEASGKDIKAYAVVAVDSSANDLRWGASIDSKGRYELKLPFDHTYLITASAEERWPKTVVVDLHGVRTDARAAGLTITIDLALVAPFTLQDSTLPEVPVGRATYHTAKRNMVWDARYSDAVKKRWDAERRQRRPPAKR